MKDINITVDINTRKATPDYKFLGVEGENLQGKIIFKFKEGFINGIAWLEVDINGVKSYKPMTKVENTYQIDILSSLLTFEKIFMNLRITEDENAEGIPVFKSKIFQLRVNKTINAVKEMPEEYPTWLDVLNQAINETNTLNIEIVSDSLGNKIVITKKDGITEETYVSGVSDYEDLENKPSINGKELIGNKTLEDLGIDQDFVKDDNYVHTDNNFTDTEKTKLANLQNYDDTNIQNEIEQLETNKAGKDEIPDVSDFITKDVNNLTNYYNKTYIDETIGNIETLLSEV